MPLQNVASQEHKKNQSQPKHLSINDDKLEKEILATVERKLTTHPEELLLQSDEYESMYDSEFDVIKDDEVAQLVLIGWLDGLKGKELMKFSEIDQKTLDTKQKFIRRRIESSFPKGLNSEQRQKRRAL